MKAWINLAGCSLVMAWGLGKVNAQLPDIATGTISVEVALVTAADSPVELVPLNDGSGRLFVVEQAGRIKILRNGATGGTPFLDIHSQIVAGGEKGLLGLAFHPGFSNPASPGFRRLYTYTTETPNGVSDFTVPMSGFRDNRCVITEWQVSPTNPDVVDLSSRREVLRIAHPQSNHNAGKIAFRTSDGYLYIAIGDGGGANDVGDGHTPNLGNGQDTTNLLGKILRIDPLAPAQNPGSTDPISANTRYRVPATNPFVNGPGLDEIYAYGFRNPYRFSFDPTTDRLLVADVGQNTIEEVDIVQAGGNYGWNRREGSFIFNPATGSVSPISNPNPAFLNPTLEYDHDDGISVIGGFVYRGSAIPALSGRYIFGDFLLPSAGTGRLFQGDLTTGTIEELRIGVDPRPLGMQVKGIGIDTAGEIYVLTDNATNTDGAVRRIIPIPATPALLNLSTRARVEADSAGSAIAGFILTGSEAKTVVLRAVGPSLMVSGQPVPGRLLNPTLSLRDENGVQLDANDDWMTGARTQELMNFGLAPTDPRESALVATLLPGAYTAIMQGVNATTGIGLVELFDADQSAASNAANLSTRGRVQSGDNVMIGGLIIGGTGTQRVICRAIGPSLAGRGVNGSLQDPTLELVDASGTRIRFNDNWRSDQEAEIMVSGVPPTNDAESALIETLSPGHYTAIMRSADSSIGVGLVEIYRLNP
jgi:glucose/arabinose dehydrogenase